MRRILVTGGAGFIGSNFVRMVLSEHPDCFVVNLDKLTYAGNLENLAEFLEHKNHKFIKGDICDGALVETVTKYEYFIKDLAAVETLSVGLGLEKPEACAAEVVGGLERCVPLAGLIDPEIERERLAARLEKAEKSLSAVEGKLSNAAFVENAPEEIVSRERERLDAVRQEGEKLRANLADIAG